MTSVNETKEPTKKATLEEQLEQLREDIYVRDRIVAAKEKELTNAFMMVSQSIGVIAAKTEVALEMLLKLSDMTEEELTKVVIQKVEDTLRKQQEAIAEAAKAQQAKQEAATSEQES